MLIYLDNAATTKVNEDVAKAIYESMQNTFANASSLYAQGAQSEMQITKARESIASLIKAKSQELIFTSCASESNNIALYGLALARKNWGNKVVITGYEHPAIYKPANFLKELGFEVIEVLPNENGEISIEEILNKVDNKTVLVSTIHVNNETGAIIDIEQLAKKIKEKNNRTAIHIDAVQSFMKYKLDVAKLNIESLSFSAHKIGGPKGIGGLYLKKGTNIKPIMLGGGQEFGIRAGTENIHYIVGLEKACDILYKDINKNLEHYKQLKQDLINGLNQFDNVIINSPNNSAPYTINFSFMGYRSETVLHFLENYNICVSSGSACSKGSQSHTLTQMGLANDRIDSAIRVSFSPQTTTQEIAMLIKALCDAKEKLQKVKR